MKIVVLLGGASSEREVSLRSGEAVYQALVSKGHQVEKVDLSPTTPTELLAIKPDVVFIALHGKPGEDGTVQGMLELMGIPYTGSSVLSSALTMDKVATKRFLQSADIATPPFMVLTADEVGQLSLPKVEEKIMNEIGLPAVIKAPTQGSTLGTYIVKQPEKIAEAIQGALQYDRQVLIEKFITGPEITVGVLGNEVPEVLPTIEIVAKSGVYDYESKYTPGFSDHIIPARLSQPVLDQLKEIAAKTYCLFGCRGFARVDFIVENGEAPQVLELNSIPGLTSTSLVPDAARAVGIEFPDLIQKVIDLALAE